MFKTYTAKTPENKVAENKRTLSEPLPVGDIQFYDNYLPAFKDGTYTISVGSSVSYDTEVKDNNNDLPDVSQSFAISGPRFSLEAEDIHTLYPPQNSSGQFETHLPHIIFNKRVLPWERALKPDSARDIPWIVLLIFEEGELRVPSTVSSSPTKAITRTVRDWQNDPSVFKPDLNLPSSAPELNQSCQIIQVEAAVFRKLVPHLSELKYLTHCRQINKINTGDQETGWFSVVLGNRFPKAPLEGQSINIVHLVSLEGLADALENQDITQPLQLISLASWAFTCLPDPKENFEGLMDNIANQEMKDKGALTLPLESGEEVPEAINQYFSRGYAPLSYQTRTAEKTFAWYRGPLTPNAIAPTPALTGSSKTGNAAIIYDEESGVFDLSYAAAWQLGRSLALQDVSFTQTLMQLRLQQKQKLYAKLRQEELKVTLTQTELPVSEKSAPTLQSKPLDKLILHAFAKGLKTHVEGISTSHYPAHEHLANPKKTPPTRLEKYNHRWEHLKALQNNTKVDAIPSNLIGWINQLISLKALPFQYLVSHSLMLPNETIRFFYVDPNWIDRLIEGAFSIGLHCQQDIAFNEQIKAQVKKSINSYPCSGFLLRSQVVSGWPGLVVRVDDMDDPPDNLRADILRLASNVLLVLFKNNPATQIQICQPQEQLSFGVEGDTLNDGKIALRVISGADLGIVLQPSETIKVTDYLRDLPDRVLNIGPSDRELPPSDKTLLTAFKSVFNKTLTPAELAIQFMRAPLGTRFKVSNTFEDIEMRISNYAKR